MSKIAPKISTVIAGPGRAGWDIHWRQLLKGHPAYRVVGAIEPVAERRAEAEIGCRIYPSFDAFLADPVGEMIVVATPSGGHGPESLREILELLCLITPDIARDALLLLKTQSRSNKASATARSSVGHSKSGNTARWADGCLTLSA